MSLEVPIIVLTLAIPLYFLSKWGLKKFKIGSTRNRKYWAILPAMILSPLVYVSIILIVFFSMSYYPKDRFNAQSWHENHEMRYTMSKDIIKSELLIGKTKPEILELLGDAAYEDDDHITYDLGIVPTLTNIDSDVLEINFENGKVVKVVQRRT